MATRLTDKNTELLEKRFQKTPSSRVFSRLADAYRKEGNINKAIEICQNGLQNHPDYIAGHLILGRCFFEQDNFSAAYEEFKKVCTLDRHNQIAIKMLADLFIKQGMDQKAGNLYQVLYKMDPFNASIKKLADQYHPDTVSELFEVIGIQAPELQITWEHNPENDELSDFTEAYNGDLPDSTFENQFQSEQQPFNQEFSSFPADQAFQPEVHDNTVAFDSNDIEMQMSQLFDDESSEQQPDQIDDPQSSIITAHEESFTQDILTQSPAEENADITGQDISSRIDELFSEPSDKGPVPSTGSPSELIQTDESPLISDDNQFFQDSNITGQDQIFPVTDLIQPADEDQQFDSSGSDYVQQSSGQDLIMESSPIIEETDPFTGKNVSSEFEETMQFERSFLNNVLENDDQEKLQEQAPATLSQDLISEIRGEQEITQEPSITDAFDPSSFIDEALENSQPEAKLPSQGQEPDQFSFDTFAPDNQQLEDSANADISTDDQVLTNELSDFLSDNQAENSTDDNNLQDTIDSSLFIDEPASNVQTSEQASFDEVKLPEVEQLNLENFSSDQNESSESLPQPEFSSPFEDSTEPQLFVSDELTDNSGSDDIVSNTKTTTDGIDLNQDLESGFSDSPLNSIEQYEQLPENISNSTNSDPFEAVGLLGNTENTEQDFPALSLIESDEESSLSQIDDELFTQPDFSNANLMEQPSASTTDTLPSSSETLINDEDLQIESSIDDQESDSATVTGNSIIEYDIPQIDDYNKDGDNILTDESELDVVNVEHGDDVLTDMDVLVSDEEFSTVSGDDIVEKMDVLFPEEKKLPDTASVDQFEEIEETAQDEPEMLQSLDLTSDIKDTDASENITLESEPPVDDTSDEKMSSLQENVDVLNFGTMSNDTPEVLPDEDNSDTEPSSMISGQDIQDRLDQFFPSDDLIDNSSKLPPMDDMEEDNNLGDFYTIFGDNAENTEQIDNLEGLENVEMEIPVEPDKPVSFYDEWNDACSMQDQNDIESELKETSNSEFVENTAAPVGNLNIIEQQENRTYSIPDHVLTPTLADIYFQQGQFDLAIQIYTRLLSRDPENETLQQKLQQIKQSAENGFVNSGNKQNLDSNENKTVSSGSAPKKRKVVVDNRPLAGVRIKKRKTNGGKNTKP